MEWLDDLGRAWDYRQAHASLRQTNCYRFFHGPTESKNSFLQTISLEKYANLVWITHRNPPDYFSAWQHRDALIAWLKSLGFDSAVCIHREHQRPDAKPTVEWGIPPDELAVHEGGLRFLIRPIGHHHPGLFLDHAPLRRALTSKCQGLDVLNTFSYTGSLSVACGHGGANKVVSLDLSRPFSEWAQQNWKANSLSDSKGDFIYGDVFEWLPRIARRGDAFDMVLCDPPSFARSAKKTFTTRKDLRELVRLHAGLIKKGGQLFVSINTADIEIDKFLDGVRDGLGQRLQDTKLSQVFRLPTEFAGPHIAERENYLKGAFFQLD